MSDDSGTDPMEQTRSVWVTVLDSEGDYLYLGDPNGPKPSPRSRYYPVPDAPPKPRPQYALWWPDEFERLPELSYWDDDKMLPRYPGGAIALWYAKSKHYKSAIAIKLLCDMALDRGAVVVYAAGEGGYGVGKQRVRAYCKKRGISPRALRGKFAIIQSVPPFKSDLEVKRFIAKIREDLGPLGVRPNIIAIDTYATATPGEDINSHVAASHLTDNGAVGKIKRAFDALVIVLAHETEKGANAQAQKGNGPLGYSGLTQNPDTVVHLVADRRAGAIKAVVEKQKDGRDGYATYYGVPPEGSDEVPVPVRITRAEYEGLVGQKAGGRPKGGSKNQGRWHDALLQLGADSYATGILEPEFARWLVAHCRAPDYGDKDPVEKELTDLRNAHQIDSLRGTLFDGNRRGGRPYKWFARREDRPLSF